MVITFNKSNMNRETNWTENSSERARREFIGEEKEI